MSTVSVQKEFLCHCGNKLILSSEKKKTKIQVVTDSLTQIVGELTLIIEPHESLM